MVQKYNKADYLFLTYVLVLVVVGMIMLTSASSVLGYEKFHDPYWYVKHQIIYGLIPGIFLFILFSKIDFKKWEKWSFPLFIINIFLLIAVFLPLIGAEYGKAKSWIYIGGFSLQPSELLKLSFILYLSTWLEKRGAKGIRDFKFGLIPFLVLLGIATFLIAMQPDIGTMSIIIVIAMVLFFVAGAKIWHMLLIGMGGAGLMGLLIKIAPYRLERFTAYLNPEIDPQGIGYHIKQALIAVGSGGILGRGLGQSRQKFLYLPEVAGDSIYAVIAEELGLILSAVIVVLFILLALRGLRIAGQSPEVYGKLVATGIIAWVIFQAFLNIGGMIDLIPMTGIPLPFISFGGTALTILLAGMGILVNISKQTRE